MGFNRDVIHRRRDQLDALGVRIRWAGRRPRLWGSVIRELESAEKQSENNTTLTLQFCVNYGGRAEIIDAVRKVAQLAKEGKLDPSRITEERFRHFLDEPDIPTSTCSGAPAASSARATSCSGRPRTPSSSSPTPCGPTSTGEISGAPSRPTHVVTAASAAPWRTPFQPEHGC